MHIIVEGIMEFLNSTVFTDEPGNDDQRREYMHAIGVWELVICIVGTPANCLVLYLAIHIARKGGSMATGKQHWFVASMTGADLLFTALHSPMFYALYTLGKPFWGFSCSMFYMVTHVSIVGSSLSLLLLNVDKFLALHKPLHYRTLMTKYRVIALLITSWIISISWAIFLVFGPFLVVTSNCGPEFKPEYRIMYYVFTVLFFATPVCVSVLIAVFVTAVARRSRKMKLSPHSGAQLRHMGSILSSGSGGSTNNERRHRLSNIRAITFVFTTTLWSAITLLPYRFAFIFNLMGYSSIEAQSIFLTMTTMNALGNPFITIATQYQYRKGLKRLWRCVLHRPSLADNELLSQHMATTIRLLCQQQEQLLTLASRRPPASRRRSPVVSPNDDATVSDGLVRYSRHSK